MGAEEARWHQNDCPADMTSIIFRVAQDLNSMSQFSCTCSLETAAEVGTSALALLSQFAAASAGILVFGTPVKGGRSVCFALTFCGFGLSDIADDDKEVEGISGNVLESFSNTSCSV